MIVGVEAAESRNGMDAGGSSNFGRADDDDDASSSHPSSPYISPRLAPKSRQGAISASDDDGHSLPPLSTAVPMRRGAVSGASMGPSLPLPPMKLPPEDLPSRGPSPANGKRPSFSLGPSASLLNEKRPSITLGSLDVKRHSISSMGAAPPSHHQHDAPNPSSSNTSSLNIDNRRTAHASGSAPYMTHPAYTSAQQQTSIRLSDDGHGYYHAAPASPRASMGSPAWSSHTASAPSVNAFSGPSASSSSSIAWGSSIHPHSRSDQIPRASSADMHYSLSPQHRQDAGWEGAGLPMSASQQQSPPTHHGSYAPPPPLPATSSDAPYRGPTHRAPSAGANPSSWSGGGGGDGFSNSGSEYPHERHPPSHYHDQYYQQQHERDLSASASEGYQQPHNHHSHRRNRSISPMHQGEEDHVQQQQQQQQPQQQQHHHYPHHHNDHHHRHHQDHQQPQDQNDQSSSSGDAPDYGGFAPIAGGKRPRSAPRVLSTQPRIFACTQCPARFARNHDLKRHQRGHLSVRPFPCDFCGKSFSRKDALKRHVAVKGCGKERRGDNDDKRGKRKHGRGSDDGPRHLQGHNFEDGDNPEGGSDEDQDEDDGSGGGDGGGGSGAGNGGGSGYNGSEVYGSSQRGAGSISRHDHSNIGWEAALAKEQVPRRLSASRLAIDSALGIAGSGDARGKEAVFSKPTGKGGIANTPPSNFSHVKRNTSIGDNQLSLQVSTTTAHHPAQHRPYGAGLYDPRLAGHHSILRDTTHALATTAANATHRPSFSLA